MHNEYVYEFNKLNYTGTQVEGHHPFECDLIFSSGGAAR